jgi:hypothetical protein
MKAIIDPVGRVSVVVVVLLLGVAVASQSQKPGREPPPGRVRAQNHAVADDNGPFNALGATMFWAPWGYKFDRARLERNLATLSGAGVDYIRVLGSVGGGTWDERPIDPRWPDYDQVISGLTDLAYDRYGMRVQWTLFGGAPFLPAGDARTSVVERFAKLAGGREHKLFAFEIANEARFNGFEGPAGFAELRRLGKQLNDRTAVLVALTAPSATGACETYAGAGADVATMHYERSFGREGPLRVLRRPWGYPAAYDQECRGQLPAVVFNNEPIGPESSVRSDADPSRIAAGFVMTFLANHAAYVLHAGPGVRGVVAPPLRNYANFDELPPFKPITTALAAAKTYLPAGLANWTRHEPGAGTAPIHGYEHVYSATSGTHMIALAVGVKKPVTLRTRVDGSLDIRDPATGKVVKQLKVKAGEAFTIGGYESLVLIGRA